MLFGLPLLILLCTYYGLESFPVTYSDLDVDENDPEETWEKLESRIKTSPDFEGDWRAEAIVTPSFKTSHPLGPLKLPEFNVAMSPIDSGVFKPEAGGPLPLPAFVKPMLLPPEPTKPAPVQYGKVDALCHLDRIYVRIKKEVFGNPEDAWKYLKVGSCPVNQNTKDHYYFLYYLKDCGVKHEELASMSKFSNTLTYNPAATGPILRELPFSVDVVCKYYKNFNSYAMGFHPESRPETVFTRLSQPSRITLTPYDDKWNPLMPGHSYTIGKPMKFEAKVPNTKADERTYINKCYMTAASDPNSSPKYTVIDNNGCLVDSKMSSSSKFIAHVEKTTLRFSIGAFVFKESVPLPTGQRTLYMHCEIAVGPMTPCSSAKSCTYDKAAKRWTELYGDASVCSCCESTCPSAVPNGSKKMVSSYSWKLPENTDTSELRIEKSAYIPDLIEADDTHGAFEKFWSTSLG